MIRYAVHYVRHRLLLMLSVSAIFATASPVCAAVLLQGFMHVTHANMRRAAAPESPRMIKSNGLLWSYHREHGVRATTKAIDMRYIVERVAYGWPFRAIYYLTYTERGSLSEGLHSTIGLRPQMTRHAIAASINAQNISIPIGVRVAYLLANAGTVLVVQCVVLFVFSMRMFAIRIQNNLCPWCGYHSAQSTCSECGCYNTAIPKL